MSMGGYDNAHHRMRRKNDWHYSRGFQGTAYKRRSSRKRKKSGCYIATAVYGSYDCPEVWTLRRYRDLALEKTLYGRVFISAYYAISPTIVKWFGKTEWFNSLFKKRLDSFVCKLKQKGFESTPYND